MLISARYPTFAFSCLEFAGLEAFQNSLVMSENLSPNSDSWRPHFCQAFCLTSYCFSIGRSASGVFEGEVPYHLAMAQVLDKALPVGLAA